MGYRRYPVPPPTPAPAKVIARGPKFVVGADQQPLEHFPMLKALGVNTVVDVPMNRDPAQWKAAADAAGLYQIREIVGDPKEDAKDPLLLAWAHHDEPDLHGEPAPSLKAQRDATAGLGIPWFLNVDGSRLLGIQAPAAGTDYQADIDASDWLSSDIYPTAGWNRNVSPWTPGDAADKLLAMGKGKPVLMVVECSKQIQWPCPTVAEMQLILRQATSRNLKGVIFFPFDFQSPGLEWSGFPNRFWNVPPEHAVEIANFAERVNK